MYILQANLPSRTKIVDLMLKNAGEVSKVMKENMKQARRIFCTTDIWSNKLGIDSFISLTCHFVSPKDHKRHTYKICKIPK